MGRRCPRSQRPLSAAALLGSFLALLLCTPAPGAEIGFTSQTLLHGFTRESPLGGDLHYLPLHETVGLGVDGLGGSSRLSMRLSGWGRLDLGEPTGTGKSEGELTAGYLQYLHPTGDLQARVGRFRLVEGTTTGYLDGALLKAVTRPGVGLALFGGRPGESAGPGHQEATSWAGARLFSRFQLAGAVVGEAGVSYLAGDSPDPEPRRREVGGDLWLRAWSLATLSGEGVYDKDRKGMEWQKSTLRLFPARALDLALGTERYENARLFARSLNPALDAPAIDPADLVRVDSAQLSWEAASPLTLLGGVKRYRHRLADPGDAVRGELGARLRRPGEVYGLTLARVTADRAANEYRELRGFATLAPGSLRFSLEALARRYEEEISGRKDALQVVGSGGVRLGPGFLLSADLRYTESPTFDRDLGVVLRADWGTGGGTP